MFLRSVAAVACVSVTTGGCVITTAHQLQLKGHPMAEDAAACNARCRESAEPFAPCLDRCPGAVAIDDTSCPAPPSPALACTNTYRPNLVAIAAAAAVALFVIAIAAYQPNFGRDSKGENTLVAPW